MQSNATGISIISIHAPVKGATISTPMRPGIIGNFNPRSREGSDSLRGRLTYVLQISIHAPVKGATSFMTRLLIELRISIHAPVKGATRP